MKIIYEIYGGFKINDNDSVRLPIITNPSIDDMMSYLINFRDKNGTLILFNNQEEKLKPYKMSLYSDSKRYLILFTTSMEDGDIDVRTLNDGSGSKEFIPMLGEPFAAASVTKDFSLVIEVFKAFLETGDVSRDLLN
jgi:hypothetical protein